MRALWDDRGPGRLRLDAADRRTRAVLRRRVDAARPDAGLPGARGPRPGDLAAPRGRRRAGAALPGRRAAGVHRTRRLTRSTSSATRAIPSYFLIVADLINYARSVDIRVGPGRGSAAGSLVAYALRHHRHRPDRARAAVRALPQPRARVDARYRHRLRRPPPRRDGALRRRQVGQRPGRPGHHLRHHQDQGRAEGFGPGPLRPAGLRDRRPDHQGAAAADHGQGHPAVGDHRPHPRAVQGGRRGPRR